MEEGKKREWAYCHRIGCGIKKFPYTAENVSNETTLTTDEDSNHLRREKEREAILREKEKSVVCEERTELVYEQIRRRTQFINTAASVASTEEMKFLDQCLEDLMKHMGYSEFGSSVRSIENFPANRYIIKQRQKKNSRPLNKQKLANVILKVTKNGFFGKVQKRGFTNVGNRIGLAPSDNLKIIELKDLITNSGRYDEEFVKDMLSVIIEERTATEKQKAAELEEKQKAMVLAQQREREFELEKMKIQLEMQKLSQAPVTSQQLENPKLELNIIIPILDSKEDEMGLYLTIFERQVKFLNIPEKTWTAYLIGSLPPDIAQIIAREDEDDAQNYEK
ncbi:retrovirus-related Pol polyprotein from transposon 297 [Trichonephila clavipes]|nr:retrovirus-related Pol polyprotein from transposon 297 [Trichonephila clavipes]